MTTQAKGWIAIGAVLVLALTGYTMLMAWSSPAPVLDDVGEPTDTVNNPAVVDDSVEENKNQNSPAYVTGFSDDQGSLSIDHSPVPGTDVVTLTVGSTTIIVDIDWSETKGGIITYDRLTFNDASGELLTLSGPFELSDDGFIALDNQTMSERAGQIYFTTVEGRYYRYDSKSDPRLVLISQTP